MPVEPPEAPVACTLGAGDLTARVAWLANLNRRALRGQRRDDLTLELIYAAEARDDVLQMIRGEQACCAFLDFEVRDEDDAIRVVVRAPERAREAADTVFEPFFSVDPDGAGCGGCGAVR